MYCFSQNDFPKEKKMETGEQSELVCCAKADLFYLNLTLHDSNVFCFLLFLALDNF